jgi:hypothetical protein
MDRDDEPHQDSAPEIVEPGNLGTWEPGTLEPRNPNLKVYLTVNIPFIPTWK